MPVWGGVRYVDLYPGVDLEITSEGGQMVQRLAARPGADLSAVQLRVEGADAVAVDGDALRLSTAAGEVALPLLRADGTQMARLQVQPRGAQAFDVAAPFAPAHSNRARRCSNRHSQVRNPRPTTPPTCSTAPSWAAVSRRLWLRHRRGRGGQRLRDGQYLLQRLPHHAGRLRPELQRRHATPSWPS